MPKYRKENKKPLTYEPTELERKARDWGINHGYIISPLGIHSDSDNYRVGIATVGTPKNVTKDPKTYPHDEVLQKVYEYYLYLSLIHI